MGLDMTMEELHALGDILERIRDYMPPGAPPELYVHTVMASVSREPKLRRLLDRAIAEYGRGDPAAALADGTVGASGARPGEG